MSEKGIVVILAVVAYLLWRNAQMTTASSKAAAGSAVGSSFTPVTKLRATAAGNMVTGGPTLPFTRGGS